MNELLGFVVVTGGLFVWVLLSSHARGQEERQKAEEQERHREDERRRAELTERLLWAVHSFPYRGRYHIGPWVPDAHALSGGITNTLSAHRLDGSIVHLVNLNVDGLDDLSPDVLAVPSLVEERLAAIYAAAEDRIRKQIAYLQAAPHLSTRGPFHLDPADIDSDDDGNAD